MEAALDLLKQLKNESDLLQKHIENRPISVKLFQDTAIDIKQIENTLSELKGLLSFFESVERRNVWRRESGSEVLCTIKD